MKWICFSHYRYTRGYPLVRDLGILSLGLRAAGEECLFFMLDGEEPSDDPNIQTISLTNACSANWWKSTAAEVVVMMAGGKNLDPVYDAVREAGLKLVLRMDSDGRFSPRRNLASFYSGSAIYSIDQIRFSKRGDGRFTGHIKAAIRTLGCLILLRRYERQIARRLSKASLLLVETPLAELRLLSFLRLNGFPTTTLWCPQAVFLSPPRSNPQGGKQRNIACVAQWWRYQKDADLTARTISQLLSQRPDYTATFVGDGSENIRKSLANCDTDIVKRIQIYDRLPRAEIDDIYEKSQILFLASRGEGFPNVAAEASCFGCTIVGWADIAAFQYFSSRGAGTAAPKRSQESLLMALLYEISAWEYGWRDPDLIAARFRAEFAPASSARRLASGLQNGIERGS